MFCEICSEAGNSSPLIYNKGSHICMKCLIGFNDVVIEKTEYLPLSGNAWNTFSNKVLEKLQSEIVSINGNN